MECLIFYVLNPKSMRFVFMLALAYWSRGSSNQDRIHLRVSKSCFFEKWFKCFRFHQFGCAFLVKAMDRKIIETVRNISCNYNIFQNSLWEGNYSTQNRSVPSWDVLRTFNLRPLPRGEPSRSKTLKGKNRENWVYYFPL